jgi:hypothetical protein
LSGETFFGPPVDAEFGADVTDVDVPASGRLVVGTIVTAVASCAANVGAYWIVAGKRGTEYQCFFGDLSIFHAMMVYIHSKVPPSTDALSTACSKLALALAETVERKPMRGGSTDG